MLRSCVGALCLALLPLIPCPAASLPAGLAAIPAALREEIAAHHLPGAVILVGQGDKILYRAAFGARRLRPRRLPMRVDTIFDLASLTKVVVTSVAIMQLAEQGRLELDSPAALYWPDFAKAGKEAITIRQLLTHMSGLPADFAEGAAWSGRETAYEMLAEQKPVRPPGDAFLYSDLDFIALGVLVERITGESLDRYAAHAIFTPLRMKDSVYRPPAAIWPRIAPTEMPRKGAERPGLVQDPTARAMGGVAGHAGLFSTADDLGRFARMLLNGGSLDGVRILSPASVAKMTAPSLLPGGVRRGLGWDMDSPYAADLGPSFSKRSYGHTGYTGTALWLDPESNSFVVILASRLHPDGKGEARDLRRKIAQIVGDVVRPRLLPGIDVLADQGFLPLRGKRIGLLTNNAGRDFAGHRSLDLLAAATEVKLAALFTPEHGLGADREGKIASTVDAATGLPVYSLYGERRQPDAEMLAGLDGLVVDLQDAGVRFYTYPSTVASLMKAAAQRDIEIFILDRPDPVNAAIVEGPLLDPARRSFTGYFPMPLRPGMTLGELAAMFNAEDGIGARLTVIPMQGYRRDLWYDQTGLAWVAPSPNLRSPLAAILYAGVGMIEGANVSVGRGTPTPFELLGAPWIDGKALAETLNRRAVPGVRFRATRFRPTLDPYRGRLCQGVRIILADRTGFDAGRLGLELAQSLYRLHSDRFDLAATASLIGSDSLVSAVASGASPQRLEAEWQPDLRAFGVLRDKYLLYR